MYGSHDEPQTVKAWDIFLTGTLRVRFQKNGFPNQIHFVLNVPRPDPTYPERTGDT